MTLTPGRTSSRDLRTLFQFGALGGLTDGQLMERFATRRDEGSELAFAALVERHGPMVLRVCRGVLRDDHEAMDACQATFLVLARKGQTLWVRDSLGPWLHRVACRASRRAKAQEGRRRALERRAAEGLGGGSDIDDRGDLAAILHEELDRLPDRYRVPIVLCDLEGRTCEEVAQHLGRPVGTVKSWRARGRERLRDRLSRRGLAGSTSIPIPSLISPLPAIPCSTLDAIVRIAASWRVAGTVPATVLALTEGVLSTMLMTKLKAVAAAVVAAGAIAGSAGVFAYQPPTPRADRPDSNVRGATVGEVPPPVPTTAPSPAPGVGPSGNATWPLTLREAIGIGLDNSEVVQIIAGIGTPVGEILISPPSPDSERWRWKAEVMAHVRSIEQRYWSLAQMQVELWSRKTAVSLGEEILKREQSMVEVGRGSRADMDEAQQRLEQFRLDFVTKTSDVITAERRLRNLIGLPPADSRRIVPVTAPLEAKTEPDWDACLAEMHEKQPDIARQKDVLKAARIGDLESRLLSATKDQITVIQSQKASLDQIVHQTTHSLARSFVEIDANYKNFQVASRLRAAASQQLEAQKAFYEEGGGTIDRYLDAVAQLADAVAREVQFKMAYNVSLVALEEAKGTLLEHDKIVVAEGPEVVPGHSRDDRAKTASLDEVPTKPDALPPTRQETDSGGGKTGRPTVGIPRLEAEGKTVSFQLTIGAGSRPLEIRGSFTVTPNTPAGAVPARTP